MSSRPDRPSCGKPTRSHRRCETVGSTRGGWPTTRASSGPCSAARWISAGPAALPVDVRFCLDCEEEVGGTAIVDYLEETAGEVRACVIFDTAMLDVETPVLTIATRGTVYLHVEVRTGERDLHSGVYGGAALNALHVLVGRTRPRHGARRASARATPGERHRA